MEAVTRITDLDKGNHVLLHTIQHIQGFFVADMYDIHDYQPYRRYNTASTVYKYNQVERGALDLVGSY